MLEATQVVGGVHELTKSVLVKLHRHIVPAPDIGRARNDVDGHIFQHRTQAGEQVRKCVFQTIRKKQTVGVPIGDHDNLVY